MSLLAAHWVSISLIRQESEINHKMLLLDQKLTDLQRYSSNIGSGNISMQSLLDVPSSIFNRAVAFMNYSHNGAIMGAQRNMQMMGPQIAMQMQQLQQTGQNNPQMQQMYQKWIFNNLYKQELEKYQKQETKLLNQQEEEIKKEREKLSSQLKIIQLRKQTADKMQQEGLQSFKA